MIYCIQLPRTAQGCCYHSAMEADQYHIALAAIHGPKGKDMSAWLFDLPTYSCASGTSGCTSRRVEKPRGQQDSVFARAGRILRQLGSPHSDAVESSQTGHISIKDS
jgi:hypothetical protein